MSDRRFYLVLSVFSRFWIRMWCGIPAHQGPVSVESSPEVEQSCGKRVTSLVHGGLLLSVLLGLFCGSGALALSSKPLCPLCPQNPSRRPPGLSTKPEHLSKSAVNAVLVRLRRTQHLFHSLIFLGKRMGRIRGATGADPHGGNLWTIF